MNENQKAVIANLSISEWSGKKQDKKVSLEIDTTHDTDDAGIFSKNLITKSYLAKIAGVRQKLRACHEKHSLPWGTGGDRLLPAKKILQYSVEIDKLKHEFTKAVKDFVDQYQVIIDEAKDNLKDLFKATDYPSNEDIRRRFGVNVVFYPVPTSVDFRLDSISPAEMDEIKAKMEVEFNDRHIAALQEIYERVSASIEKMLFQIDGDGKRITQSMLDNIKDLVDSLPLLNYTDDPKLKQLAKDLKSLVIDANTLRDNEDIRKYAATRAKELQSLYF
jgi:DNA-binding ferritin-like protein